MTTTEAIRQVEEAKQSPLLVRLLEDVGKLPRGLVYCLPAEYSLGLIRRRVALPVGSNEAFADVSLSEDELSDIGFDWAAIQAA